MRPLIRIRPKTLCRPVRVIVAPPSPGVRHRCAPLQESARLLPPTYALRRLFYPLAHNRPCRLRSPSGVREIGDGGPFGHLWDRGTGLTAGGPLWTPGDRGFAGGLDPRHARSWGPRFGLQLGFQVEARNDGYVGVRGTGVKCPDNRSVARANPTILYGADIESVIDRIRQVRVSDNGSPGGMYVVTALRNRRAQKDRQLPPNSLQHRRVYRAQREPTVLGLRSQATCTE